MSFSGRGNLGNNMGGNIPGWQDVQLQEAALKEMSELQQHKVWWEKKNNGVPKSWVMQDGCSPASTRYRDTDGAPWVFVCECKDSGIPMDALNVVYIFSPASMTNMRGAVVPTARLTVPTARLTPKLEALGTGGDLTKRWKAAGIWKHVYIHQQPNQQQEEDESNDAGGFSMHSLRNNQGRIKDN